MAEVIEIPRIPSLSALDATVAAGLKEVPILIIDHEFPGTRIPAIRFATESAGKKLANLLGGNFVYEKKLPYLTGLPLHVDGAVPRYYQVNTSEGMEPIYPKEGEQYGVLFTMQQYLFTQRISDDIIRRVTLKGYEPDRHTTSFSWHDFIGEKGEKLRNGISDELRRAGDSQPTHVRDFTGFVRLGATVVFVNGTGSDGNLFVHGTQNAIKKPDGSIVPSHFLREVSLGRVEIKQPQSRTT